MFIGRKNELAELERLYKQDGFHIFVLYGREGSGKTTLAEEFCKDKDNIFFAVFNESVKASIARFSKQVLKYYKDEKHAPFLFWTSALEYIMKKQNGKRIILVLDDFTYLLERDPALLENFRKCIKDSLKDSKMFIIITSSNTRALRKYFTNSTSLAFPRVTGSLMLEKFTLTDDIVEQLKQQAVKDDSRIDTRKIIKFSADDVILREGELNSEMYKIISGKAVCYFNHGTENEYLIGTLKEGRSFGEFSLLTGKPGIYTVVAFSDLLVLRIGSDEFSKFIEMNASNAVEIMKNMAGMINILKVNIDMLRGEDMQSLQ